MSIFELGLKKDTALQTLNALTRSSATMVGFCLTIVVLMNLLVGSKIGENSKDFQMHVVILLSVLFLVIMLLSIFIMTEVDYVYQEPEHRSHRIERLTFYLTAGFAVGVLLLVHEIIFLVGLSQLSYLLISIAILISVFYLFVKLRRWELLGTQGKQN